ncbi:MAG: threonine/serine exporter family protein [Puniceicoccales bacterium]
MEKSREEMHRIAKLLLRTARMLLEHGAETRRVFETMESMGKRLGVEDLHILVTHRSVMVTVGSETDAVTQIIRVGTLGVNMTTVSAISRVYHGLPQAVVAPEVVERELDRISAISPHYPRWMVLAFAGLSCGGFSQLFGGDWLALVAASAAASCGLFVRQELHKRSFQPLLCVFAAAFVSVVLSVFIGQVLATGTPAAAHAASVLYLVPGVPMINAVADLVKGHLLTGLARAISILLIGFCVSLAVVLAINLVGFNTY